MIPDTVLARQFQQEWAAHYGGLLPLGWILRTDDALPWVRFHSLPESKRYADDESERAIILDRANQLGDWLLGSSPSCWVVEAVTASSDDADALVRAVAEDDDADSPIWFFYARVEQWEKRRYDALLLAIADDGPNQSLWMNRATGTVFAPYDGGFDLFPPTWREVDELKSKWPDWLSDHPEGL